MFWEHYMHITLYFKDRFWDTISILVNALLIQYNVIWLLSPIISHSLILLLCSWTSRRVASFDWQENSYWLSDKCPMRSNVGGVTVKQALPNILNPRSVAVTCNTGSAQHSSIAIRFRQSISFGSAGFKPQQFICNRNGPIVWLSFDLIFYFISLSYLIFIFLHPISLIFLLSSTIDLQPVCSRPPSSKGNTVSRADLSLFLSFLLLFEKEVRALWIGTLTGFTKNRTNGGFILCFCARGSGQRRWQGRLSVVRNVPCAQVGSLRENINALSSSSSLWMRLLCTFGFVFPRCSGKGTNSAAGSFLEMHYIWLFLRIHYFVPFFFLSPHFQIVI